MNTSSFPRCLSILMAMSLVTLVACVDRGHSASTEPTARGDAATTVTTPAPLEERCVSATVEQSPTEGVGGADLAAWLIEDQMPPPLRVSGLQSNETIITLNGDPVGEVSTEEVGDGLFIATGYTFCVPADLDLNSIDVAATLGGDWQLADSRPELGIPADAEVRLTISDDRAGGRAVCNEYGGLVAAGPEGAWRISEFGFTEQACGEAESDYFDRFGSMTSWSLDGPDLVLDGPDGSLRYAPG